MFSLLFHRGINDKDPALKEMNVKWKTCKGLISDGLDRMKLHAVHCVFYSRFSIPERKNESYLLGVDPVLTPGSTTVAKGLGSHRINMTTVGLSPLHIGAIPRERRIVSWGTIPRGVYYRMIEVKRQPTSNKIWTLISSFLLYHICIILLNFLSGRNFDS